MGSRRERRELQESQRNQQALQQQTKHVTELLLVRHGETSWNVDGRLQGQLMPGPALTARGRQQAMELAERLRGEPLDAIYTSDLQRALETAQAVAAARCQAASRSGGAVPPPPVCIDVRLRERCLGVLQGLTHGEAAARHPEAYATLSDAGAAAGLAEEVRGRS